MNPRGGAIAIGHPLGNTGARMVATVVSELIEEKKGVCACIIMYLHV